MIVATPDRAIEAAARAVAPSLDPGALVIHLAGSLGVGAFDAMLEVRPDVRVGALHPLQTFPSASIGVERLRGAWAAVAGDPQTTELARARPPARSIFADGERAQYHAAAVVASNHLVALLGQVERLAECVRCSVRRVRPARAVVGDERARRRPRPRAHGPGRTRRPRVTVEQHLATLDPGERDTRTGRWRARSPGSPAAATMRSTVSSTTSATPPVRETPPDAG